MCFSRLGLRGQRFASRHHFAHIPQEKGRKRYPIRNMNGKPGTLYFLCVEKVHSILGTFGVHTFVHQPFWE